MVEIPASKPNADLAQAVNSRINSDARIIKAKAGMWSMGGFALLALGIGAAIALVLWGVARNRDVSSTADTIAAAIATALKDTKLTLDEKSVVKLDAKDQSVRLDTAGATVLLDPASKVVATGTVTLDPNARVNVVGSTPNVPRPTPEQYGVRTESHKGKTVHTNFTVFKETQYGQGKVVTGYAFNGDDRVPATQFCYYTTPAVDGASIRLDLARDMIYLAPKNAPRNVDVREAASSCIWYDGSPTRYM